MTKLGGGRRQSLRPIFPWRRGFSRRLNLIRRLVLLLVFIALASPIYFHLKLRRFHQMQMARCGWLGNPPLICAHGGDSTNAFPNTMGAYHIALRSQVDCIEIDVSRSSDGVLFALHDRDLQQISRNHTSKVGYFSSHEIRELHLNHQFQSGFNDRKIPTIEDSLMLISRSVRQVILDAKVGPPAYEKGLTENILSVVERTNCMNCIVWAKSDSLVRDIIRRSANITVGYIVMNDSSAGNRSTLLRMKKAVVVGVYHVLIDEKIVKTLHGRNKRVYAWTVDDEVSMKRMLYERVDGIVTSNPTLLQQVMLEMRTRCLEEGFSLR
ncbi:hypothetical protein Nepgr_023379 [Nepenthes gracilis]|uniref:glycerophosphodiester phosphodiesterase n=1 Tax=Nepenthes gracilis TaxID=150966 RepID=A0AAD3XXN4_NEPGR|nr:hypothetical protein Nepgr_023379 [Nepenthes gracilis]